MPSELDSFMHYCFDLIEQEYGADIANQAATLANEDDTFWQEALNDSLSPQEAISSYFRV